MQYVLSEEEYKNMVPIEKHREVRNGLLDVIGKYRAFINKNIPFKCINSEDSPEIYCDNCPYSKYHLNECILKQNYKL